MRPRSESFTSIAGDEAGAQSHAFTILSVSRTALS